MKSKHILDIQIKGTCRLDRWKLINSANTVLWAIIGQVISIPAHSMLQYNYHLYNPVLGLL